MIQIANRHRDEISSKSCPSWVNNWFGKVRELVHEGNVRRIIIKQEGHTILEIPLTVGVVGVILQPALVAIGAIGALMAQCSIEVVRSERPTPPPVNSVPPTSTL